MSRRTAVVPIAPVSGGPGIRRRSCVVALVATMASAMAIVAVGSGAAQAVPSNPVVTSYGLSGAEAQHQTEVGTDVFAWPGKGMVTVYQAGRDNRFGATAMGYSYSTDGTTWQSGYIPGVTTLTPGAPALDPGWQRVTDVSVTYDDQHQRWVAAAAVQNKQANGDYEALVISTSTSGTSWGIASVVEATPTLGPDKPWVTCDNATSSPRYGRCYVAFSNTLLNGTDRNVYAVSSTNGFASVSAPVKVSTGGASTAATARYNAQPVALPTGNVAIVATFGNVQGTQLSVVSYVSGDGGAIWGAENPIGTLNRHSVPAVREFIKPNVEVDANGRIYVVAHGCTATPCNPNRMNLATSTDGVSWGAGFTSLALTAPDPSFAAADLFATGLAVAPGAAGPAARLALAFYWQPTGGGCTSASTAANCQLNVGLTSSVDNGTSWRTVTTLNASPAQPGWLAGSSVTPARYASDYLGVGFTSSTVATAVFPHAIAPTGTTFNERLYTASVDTASPPAAPTVPPSGVNGLAAVGSANGSTAQATLTFTPPNDGGGVPITNWRVTYRKTAPLLDPAATTIVPDYPGQSQALVVANLTPGATYDFTVTPMNAVGLGGASTTRTVSAVMLNVPSAPATVTAVGGVGSITLSWSAVPDPAGNPVTGYDITAAPALPGGTLSVGAATTSTVLTGLAPGTTYQLAVAAKNTLGTGIATLATTSTFDVPSTPTGVSAQVSGTTATVSFAAPGFDGGTAINGYKVFDGANQVATGAGSPLSVTGLAVGSHSLTVRATNAVGDGPPSVPAVVTIAGTPPGPVAAPGYWMVASDGRVFNFGAAAEHGGAESTLRALGIAGVTAVDLEPTPGFGGYWILDSNGAVYPKGNAKADLGNAGLTLTQLAGGERATALSSTPSGQGYWIFTNRGRAVAKGDAIHRGDMALIPLNGPVLDSIPTPSGNGYYMVGSDGGIFAFGDARFFGSMGDQRLNAPVQSLVPTASGLGYWLVAADGGIFAFGDAGFVGSIPGVLKPGQSLNRPITGMVRYGSGYLMVGEDGGIFSFSDQPFLGSLGDNPPDRPIVSVAAQGT